MQWMILIEVWIWIYNCTDRLERANINTSLNIIPLAAMIASPVLSSSSEAPSTLMTRASAAHTVCILGCRRQLKSSQV
ncbi:hypothetical protein RRG08_066302 [Elysia crispata]|uniref:Uncharacterized protein n=1 Tax=Elysia crispata TaxID=231223 RepID=A0AAE1E191_9GAST|nr:hypothetical protein RRG08_066302 [Elysia crispata]